MVEHIFFFCPNQEVFSHFKVFSISPPQLSLCGSFLLCPQQHPDTTLASPKSIVDTEASRIFFECKLGNITSLLGTHQRPLFATENQS